MNLIGIISISEETVPEQTGQTNKQIRLTNVLRKFTKNDDLLRLKIKSACDLFLWPEFK